MDESDDEQETIRVVPSYTPKVVATTNVKETRAIDPITGKSVSVADMPEHMRIQLLDPKWAEERKKFQAAQKDSNLVAGDAVVANLSRIAKGGLFGKSVSALLNSSIFYDVCISVFPSADQTKLTNIDDYYPCLLYTSPSPRD